METVIFLGIMWESFTVVYIGMVIANVDRIFSHTYFILMHMYFIGFILARRMYKDKKDKKKGEQE